MLVRDVASLSGALGGQRPCNNEKRDDNQSTALSLNVRPSVVSSLQHPYERLHGPDGDRSLPGTITRREVVGEGRPVRRSRTVGSSPSARRTGAESVQRIVGGSGEDLNPTLLTHRLMRPISLTAACPSTYWSPYDHTLNGAIGVSVLRRRIERRSVRS